MRDLIRRIALIQADIAQSLDKIPAWRQVVEIAAVVCSPVTGLARATLAVLPFLRKLEWLLEIELLTQRHPVILALSMLFIAWRGLSTTPLGHIGTDKVLYPLLGAIGGFNPFLGFFCGGVYGVADLAQKLVYPDMYGAQRWGDPNYWGGMAGYVVAYSSIMMMGLFPGMVSRVFRLATRTLCRKFFFNRAAASADGATPLAAAQYPLAELAASAVGAFATGYVVMHEIAPVTERPAFYWRPNPDVSCHNLEVHTHLEGRAPIGGTGASVGGVVPVLTPPPLPPPPAPPPIPDEFEWTAPNGVTYVVKKNDQGQYINILTGGMVDVTNLDKWKQTWSDNIRDQQQWSQEQRAAQEARTGWFDKEMDKMVQAQKDRAKAMQNLSQMEKNIIFGNGPESQLYRPPGEPGNILTHIKNLQTQIMQGKSPDKSQLDKVYQVYKDQKQGKIIQPSQMPTQTEIRNEIITGTITSTANEFITGKNADGTTSWLGTGGRALTAIATGGASEVVLVPVNATITMKDYVDKGGNSVLGGFKEAVITVVTDEITGAISGGVLKAGGRVGAALGEAGAEVLTNAAKNGSSAAKAIVGAAKAGTSAAGKVVNVLTTPIGSKPPNLGTAVKAPSVPIPPDKAAIIRNNARAGSTGVTIKPAGIDPKTVPNGITPAAEKHVKMVAENRGVIIDVRPTTTYAKPLIESGKAVPKASYVKTKTLTPDDLKLGAKGEPGMVGYYKPKLPPQGNMSAEEYAKLKELYNKRLGEFKDNSHDMIKLEAEGKVFVKDGVVYNGKPPGNKPFTGDNDIFEIRDATTGKPIPRYMVDHKGNVIMDPKTGQPKLNPVREAIIKDLQQPPYNNQHGAHMDWKYDHTSKDVPGGSPPGAQSPYDKNQMIDKNVIDKHRPKDGLPGNENAGGEPVIGYGPGGQVSTGYVSGGR